MLFVLFHFVVIQKKQIHRGRPGKSELNHTKVNLYIFIHYCPVKSYRKSCNALNISSLRDFCQKRVAFYPTNMVFACANNLWDCPVRDKILVEREIEIIESPVRDAIYFCRTKMIFINEVSPLFKRVSISLFLKFPSLFHQNHPNIGPKLCCLCHCLLLTRT